MAKEIVKLDKDYFSAAARQELAQSESWMSSELAEEQAENIRYYNGDPRGDEIDGFSSVISRDVLETVEGIMPELMKIFTSADQVVEFDAIGPDDEDKVEIQGRYINHVFMNRGEGYKVMYDWFKDALLMKNGIIKVGWDAREEVQFRTYEGLTEDEYESIKDAEYDDETLLGTQYELESYEKIKKEKKSDPQLYNVRLKLERMRGRPCVEVIPSEEFRIRQRSKSIKDSDFVAHVMLKTVGELLELGYDEDDIEDAITQWYIDGEEILNARFEMPAEAAQSVENSKYDRQVQYAECWIKTYDPEDKKVKLYKTVQIGHNCVEYEETDRVPLISLAPIMTPHRFVGTAVADLVKDIQDIRSTLYRQMLDNLALQNAGRYTAVEGQVNLQDLIDNRIGGIIRQKMPNAVQRLDTPDLSMFTIPMLDQLEVQRENRTGVSRMTAGLDPNALKSHQAGGAVNAVMTAAQGKILLIARNFAETGVKELFLEIYNLIREYQTKTDLIAINGRFAVVNPPEWQERHDVHVTVGVGNGNKDQQLMHLQGINQMIMGIAATDYSYLITPENFFNLASETIKNSGYYNPTKFITSPAVAQKPEPQPDPQMIAAQAAMTSSQAQMLKAQQNGQTVQVDGQTKIGTMQLNGAKFEWEKKIQAAEVGLEAEQKRPVGIGDK